MLIYLIIGVFIAGLMVGRTPEYLGKKVEAREMKLAMLALLVHPILILMPTGYFAATDWGLKAMNNPGAHGFSEVLYEFSSASANNGSGFGGLTTAWGSYDPKSPIRRSPQNPLLGHRHGPGDALWALPPRDRTHGHGRQPGREEADALYGRNDADRHLYFRLRAAGNDHPGRRPVVPAGSGPRPGRRAFRPAAVWRLIDIRTCRVGRAASPPSSARSGLATATPYTNNTNITMIHNMMSTATLEPQTSGPSPQELKLARRQSRKAGLFDPQLMKTAFWQSLVMLRPDIQWKNPVMFVVEIGTVLTLVYTVAKMCGAASAASLGYLLSLGLLAGGNAALRQLRFVDRRSPRQGPGRRPAEDPAGNPRPPPQGRRHVRGNRLHGAQVGRPGRDHRGRE